MHLSVSCVCDDALAITITIASIYLPITILLSLSLSISLSLYLSISLSLYLSISLSLYLSISLSLHFICAVYQSIHKCLCIYKYKCRYTRIYMRVRIDGRQEKETEETLGQGSNERRLRA